jgi:broad specificity phosphatase PhoE
MRQLILVRHGESAWNAEGRLQGDADIELSEHGRRQARGLASLVRELSPTEAVTSDLGRARETADLLGHPGAVVDPAWREANLGEWTGLLVADLIRDDGDGYQAWRSGHSTAPGGEAWDELRARVTAALEGLTRRDGRYLVVTHGGPIRAACAALIGLEPMKIVPVSPASVTILDLDPIPRLRAFNLTPVHAPQETAE